MVFCLTKERADHRNKKQEKPNRKDKCDLGEDFKAPDGGWGWLVCLAAGCSNLVAFTVIQQFGLLFRERLSTLGFSNSQITTMINVNSALSASTGLLNGPMFRRFSYRQVALTGATLMTSGLLLTSIADSFLTYIITFSVLFAIGLGISISASSLALNTYFKEKRRMATGFSWTITALGPIFMPYLVTGLVDQYDVQWSVIILSAITMHSFACAMIYQPVLWHVKKLPVNISVGKTIDDGYKCVFCRLGKRKNTGIFSSQYLHNTDDEESPGYEITDPGTPMMSRANDGWFSRSANTRGSRCSLTSGKSVIFTRCTSVVKDILKETDEEENFDANTTPTMENQMEAQRTLDSNRSSINFEKETMNQASNRVTLSRKNSDFRRCTCHEERELLKSNKLEENEKNTQLEQEEDKVKLSIGRKLVLFFDLDLLKDPTYDNLMVGLTLANFAEMNFSILTPFILMDFGYSKEQTALAMSFLAGMDTIMRFIIPFFAEKIGFENRTFFLFGIFGLAIGRIMLAHTQSYIGVLIVFAWIGINKGLRTIFMALVIPSYVPLKRLPAASGLQLITMGIFSIIAGPIVGLIRDATDYRFTLHCINIITFSTITSWGLEKMYRRFCKKET